MSWTSTGTSGGYKFTVTLTEQSVGTANQNKSTLEYTVQVIADASSAAGEHEYGGTITIAGSTVVVPSATGSITMVRPFTVKSGSIDVTHNLNGDKTISFSGSFAVDQGSAIVNTTSTSATLTHIERSTSINNPPSSITIDGTTAYNLTLTRRVTSSWAKFWLKINNVEYEIGTTKGTSFSFTPDYATFSAVIAAGTSVSGNLLSRNYTGQTIGSGSQIDGVAYTCTISVTEQGNIRVKVDGSWEKGIPYIKVNGVWKKGKAYVKNNGTWELGK